MLTASAPAARAAQVLDLDDPTPRLVFIDVETSANPATLGATYGLRFYGSFTSSGGIGTIRLSAHETMQFLEFTTRPPLDPPTVSQRLEIRIDIATGAVEMEGAGQATWLQDECQPNGGVSESYALDATTDRVAGFTGTSSPVFCALQSEWAREAPRGRRRSQALAPTVRNARGRGAP